MEDLFLPINEEHVFAVQLILRTKTLKGDREPIWNPDEDFVYNLVEDYLHPDYEGRKYVLTSASGRIFYPSNQDKALPLKILEHDRYGVPSVEEIKPDFYKTDKEGYLSRIELEEAY